MAGYYSYGFEESTFMPLDDPTVQAWVRWGEVDWSPWLTSETRRGLAYPCAYVEWAGVLRGPSYYGHMLGSEFEFTVRQVFVVQPADQDRCSRGAPFKLNELDFR